MLGRESGPPSTLAGDAWLPVAMAAARITGQCVTYLLAAECVLTLGTVESIGVRVDARPGLASCRLTSAHRSPSTRLATRRRLHRGLHATRFDGKSVTNVPHG